MTAQSHTPTPGRWTVNAVAKGKIIGDAQATGAEKYQITNHHATIATVYRPTDATLIAAAPDLLAALRDICGAADRHHEPDAQPRYWAAITRARAALAKVEGH